MPRPRAGDWLADEMASWKTAGVDAVVSLLTDDEINELELQHEPAVCQALGLMFLASPIVDRDVPSSPEEFLALVDRLDRCLQNDMGVAIHCRMGIGRASLLAACLLVKAGMSVREAFDTISRSRGIEVPDTQYQFNWVASLVDRLHAE